MIVPAFSSPGETAPYVAPPRGRVVGLTTEVSKDDLAVRLRRSGSCRAACIDSAGYSRASSPDRGGSRSPAFRQLWPISGQPVSIAPQPETAARGAVICGMLAAGISTITGSGPLPRSMSPRPRTRPNTASAISAISPKSALRQSSDRRVSFDDPTARQVRPPVMLACRDQTFERLRVVSKRAFAGRSSI